MTFNFVYTMQCLIILIPYSISELEKFVKGNIYVYVFNRPSVAGAVL